MSYFSRPTTRSNSFSLEAWLDRLPCQLSPFHLTLFSRFLLVSQNGFAKVLLCHFLRPFYEKHE